MGMRGATSKGQLERACVLGVPEEEVQKGGLRREDAADGGESREHERGPKGALDEADAKHG
jgi:hypothetical protein